MSYLALARKWRPKTFQDIVGQDHVVRAISNALDSGRLHHAWLFTGTRGVGKTTLSRILAKSLNCEKGVTSTPCGVCRACTQIDEGRFVDYFEFDAASNRKAEEISLLLDQAVYAPSMGRFKVYMIDEVHMLTGHAFNAMLKTLEEPPAHVKFILATTDPQKIPMTVLSRCLQFSLKQMSPKTIMDYLSMVLTQEGATFDEGALYLLAQAARGSMRDALSVTDQAIAFSKGALTQSAIESMLGSIDQRYLVRCLDALYHQDANVVIELANELNARGFSYEGALNDLSALLTKVSIEQRVSVVESHDPLREDIIRLSHLFSQEQLQLFYTIAIHTRSELLLAPDEYSGFVMGIFKMLALMGQPKPLSHAVGRVASESSASSQSLADSLEKPLVQKEILSEPLSEVTDSKKTERSSEVGLDETVQLDETSQMQESMRTSSVQEVQKDLKKKHPEAGLLNVSQDVMQEYEYDSMEPDYPETLFQTDEYGSEMESSDVSTAAHFLDIQSITRQTWPEISRGLPLRFAGHAIIYDSEWVGFKDSVLTLKITLQDAGQLRVIRQGIETVISEACGQPIKVRFEHQSNTYSAKAVDEQKLRQQHEKAVKEAHADPFIQVLKSDFGAVLEDEQVRVITVDE